MKNRFSIKFLISTTSLLIFIMVLASIVIFKTKEQYTLNDIFTKYGFIEVEQKNSLLELLKNSSIVPKQMSFEDFYYKKETEESLINNIIDIVAQTQERFTVRSGNQERWEVKPQEWIDTNKDQNEQFLKTLGFIQEIEPVSKNKGTIGILGSTKPSMQERINFASNLVKNNYEIDSLILIAGERYVTKDIDGTEAELQEIAKYYNIDNWKKLTETHLIEYLYKHSDLYDSKLKVYLINTPKGDLPRPTTQTTILDLISKLKEYKDISYITFISKQPNIKYQQAIIDAMFRQKNIKLPYEVVGPGEVLLLVCMML